MDLFISFSVFFFSIQSEKKNLIVDKLNIASYPSIFAKTREKKRKEKKKEKK